VVEKHEEKLLQLGPVLERLHDEAFTPQIDRTFDIMVTEDMVPPWPEELSGMPLKVDFVSLLAQAQKMVATNAVDQFMGFIGGVASVDQDALDVFDTDAISDGYAEYLGIEAGMLRPKEERAARRTARQQAIQQQAQIEQAERAASIAKAMGETPMDGGGTTALDALMGGM
jgi:hypothetical protein